MLAFCNTFLIISILNINSILLEKLIIMYVKNKKISIKETDKQREREKRNCEV